MTAPKAEEVIAEYLEFPPRHAASGAMARAILAALPTAAPDGDGIPVVRLDTGTVERLVAGLAYTHPHFANYYCFAEHIFAEPTPEPEA